MNMLAGKRIERGRDGIKRASEGVIRARRDF